MPDPWTVGGAAALQRHAPTAAAALSGLVSRVARARSTRSQLTAIRTVTAEGIGLTPAAAAPDRAAARAARPATEVMPFAEQFAVDVSVIDDALRTRLVRATSARAAFDATLVVWVADYVPRVRAVARRPVRRRRLVRRRRCRRPGTRRLVMDEFLREVALLDALDPVTTELVRLRGARQHTCRLCMSRRSLDAMEAGADAATFDAVDRYRSSDLGPGQQAALGLTDAMIWTPAHLRARRPRRRARAT